MEVSYKHSKCANCGRDILQWGIQFSIEVFVCELCLINAIDIIEDRKERADAFPFKVEEWKGKINGR